MMQPLTTVALAALGVGSSLAFTLRRAQTMEDLRARVDREFADKLDRLVLDAHPGEPRDVEIWNLIREYGYIHFILQARIQVGMAFLALQKDQEATEQKRKLDSSFVSLCISVVGCIPERLASLFYPSITHMQAFTAAQIFSWLRIDVEEICGAA